MIDQPTSNGHASEIDLTRGKDREHLRRAIARGWPVSEEDMLWYYSALKGATGIAIKEQNAREIRGCVRTFVDIVGQVQTQDNHDEKTGRLDQGQPTEIVVNYTQKDSSRFADDSA